MWSSRNSPQRGFTQVEMLAVVAIGASFDEFIAAHERLHHLLGGEGGAPAYRRRTSGSPRPQGQRRPSPSGTAPASPTS